MELAARQAKAAGCINQSATERLHAMPIFSKSPAKQLADTINARDKLAERLRDAEIAVTDLRQEAERLALLGADDAQLSAAEARTREKADRVMTLQAALAQSKAAVADLERARDEAADKKQRQETSTECEALARRMSEGCAKLVADAAALSDWTARAVPVVWEANGLLGFCDIIAKEIPAASELIAKLLRIHGQNVLAGSAPAAMRLPPEKYVEPAVAPAPPTQTLFCIRSVKWKNEAGQQQIAGQFQDADLPQHLVARALKSRACVPISDPRRRELHGTAGPYHPNPAHALDLDLDEPEPAASVAQPTHPAFEKVTVGEARILKIAR